MANYMKDVAKMLGVELGQTFKCSNGCHYIFTENGLLYADNTYPNAFSNCALANVLAALLNGDCVILSETFNPKKGEYYYLVEPDGTIEYEAWFGDGIDCTYYKIGNCYHSIEDAKANRDKWMRFYSSDKHIEV